VKPVALACVVGIAAIVLAADSFELKRSEKAGAAKKYSVHLDFDFGGQAGVFNADVVHTVTAVEADGTAQIRAVMSSGLAEVGGNTMAADVPSYVAKVSPDNSVLEVTGEATDANTHRYARALMPTFPTAPVELKDGKATWTAKIAENKAKELPAWEVKSVYVGKEAQEGVDCLKIDFEMKEPEGDAPLTSKGTAWFNAKDGSMVKVISDLKGFPVQGYVIDAKMTMVLKK
jgi:hypothetical protein